MRGAHCESSPAIGSRYLLAAFGLISLGDRPWQLFAFAQIYSPNMTFAGIGPAWSLCIEVSFYLALPLWAALMARLTRGRARGAAASIEFGALAGASAGSLILHVVWSTDGDGYLGFTLPASFYLFAVGMGLAAADVLLPEPVGRSSVSAGRRCSSGASAPPASSRSPPRSTPPRSVPCTRSTRSWPCSSSRLRWGEEVHPRTSSLVLSRRSASSRTRSISGISPCWSSCRHRVLVGCCCLSGASRRRSSHRSRCGSRWSARRSRSSAGASSDTAPVVLACVSRVRAVARDEVRHGAAPGRRPGGRGVEPRRRERGDPPGAPLTAPVSPRDPVALP